MNDATLGFLLAVVASFFFGIYMVPRKSSKLDNPSFMWIMGLSLALVTLVMRFVSGQPPVHLPYDVFLSAFCGVLWFGGSVGYAQAVRLIGLARSTPYKNLGPILTTIYGVVIFHEFGLFAPAPLLEALFGSALMTGSAILLGRTSAPTTHETALAYNGELSAAERKRLFNRGLLWSLFAGFCFSGYSVPMKFVYRSMSSQAYFGYDVAVFSFLSAMGLGVGLAAVFYYVAVAKGRLIPERPSRRELGLSFFAGLFWVLAAVTAGKAMVFIPMSVSWPITNLSTLVSVALGIWWFREIKPSHHRWEIFWGLVTSAVGVLLLALATGQGRV